jgi:hypothetical protein
VALVCTCLCECDNELKTASFSFLIKGKRGALFFLREKKQKNKAIEIFQLLNF